MSKVKGKCDVVRWLDLVGIARAVEPKKIMAKKVLYRHNVHKFSREAAVNLCYRVVLVAEGRQFKRMRN